MTILLALTLAATIQPTCSWDHPGHNRYTGGTAAAVDHYADIPEAVRATLKRRMAEGQSDDRVSITRDGISGKNKYDAQIRDMHFGKASLCKTVTRDKWATERVEPAAVYCVGEHCILVPRICGNVSRISRSDPPAAAKAGEATGAPAAAGKAAGAPPGGGKTAGAAEASDQRANPDGLEQFNNISLSDAPLNEEPVELGLLDEGQADKAKRNLVGALLDEDQAEKNRRRFAGVQPGDKDRPYTPWEPGHVPNNNSADPVPQPVPEPGTWAMLLGGLGLVGWMARRRAARGR